ncbi:MAG: phage tail family protein [Bacilli bacterium]|nr:phage tail family protein [Bacilli bacterium]
MKQFIFNDVSCKDVNVVVEEIYPLLEKAAISAESQRDINNVNLEYTEFGYSNVESSLNLFITDPSKLDIIKFWLNGKGTLEYDNKVCQCAFFNSLKPVRSSSIYSMSVDFIRSPFWFKKEDPFVEVKGSIINEGNTSSDPIIKLVKQSSDYVELSINDVRFKYTFPNGEEYAEFDCFDAEITYNGLNRNKNLEIDYLFPKINPGENIVKVFSGDAKIFIKRKDCWL